MFEFKLDLEAAKEVSTGSKTIETGVYKATVEYMALGATKNGNNVVDISFKTEEGRFIKIWGLCVDQKWASGATNYDYNKWMQLAVVTGMKTGETAPFTLTLKDGTTKQLTVFKESVGKPLQVAVQRAYDVYNGEETEKNRLHSSYNIDDVNTDKVASRLKDMYSKQWKAENEATKAADIVVEEEGGSLLD